MNRKSKKSRSSNYRSGFEEDVAAKLQPCGFTYEPHQIDYTVHRKYTPDFYASSGVLVEVKGFFRHGDTQKYKAIRDSLDSAEELVFVLMKPNQKVNKATKLTMSQWCDKEGLLWYTLDNIEELIAYADSRGD